MVNVPSRWISVILLACAGLTAAAQSTPMLPLRDIKPGMKGTGRTIFNGAKVEEFQVEILGILENAGPKQSIILARLSGGPLAHTGVMQGMSGSPVYIDGKLIGAVALSFPYSKDPIAGIRPIEEMLTAGPVAPRQAAATPESLPKPQEYNLGPTKMAEIATPFYLSGFTSGAFDHFAPMLRAAGLEPVQGVSGGGRPTAPTAATPKLEPGSMISVQLVSGDMSVGADGTVTCIDGNRIFAFGHRFLSVGDTELPFARAEVITLLASQNSSFKISTPKEWLGTVTQDRTTAISGELGRKAALLPVTIKVSSHTGAARDWSYRMNIVQDRLYTPLLLQMAVYSAIDATERTIGLGTISMRGRLLVDGAPPIPLSNLYSAELGAPNQASAAAAAPISALLQSGFDALKLRGLDLEFDVSNDKNQMQIDSAWPSRREVRPGESVEITAIFTGEHGAELSRTSIYHVPVGAPTGTLYFTITDGPSANIAEYRQFLLTPPRSPAQLHAFLTGLHPNDRAYVRVWRSAQSFQIMGENLNAPPPSAALTLGRTVTPQSMALVSELTMAPGPFQFTGSKTVQVEVKD
ncbi:MAG TPA: SpoIVB peptidase S55 domain-containing protein [Paludibaculum sp.]|jgi:hypothetical protein